MRSVAVAALLFCACATSPALLRDEAVDRLAMCANASAGDPYGMRAACMPDVLAFCAKSRIKCDPEDLWSSARLQFTERDPP